jgi:hypothetical protein
MIPVGELVPVELVGGPLDGTQTEVAMKEPEFDFHLFPHAGGGRRFTLGYCFAYRTVRGGKRWVLEFREVVAAWTMTTGTGNTGEEADGR